MLDAKVYCERCGEEVARNIVGKQYQYEGVEFSQRTAWEAGGNSLSREDDEVQAELRRFHPLCPDCIADTLEFVTTEPDLAFREAELRAVLSNIEDVRAKLSGICPAGGLRNAGA